MSEPSEREDLEQLLSSPGWLRFSAFAKEQWGPVGYGRRLKQAVTQAIQRNDNVGEAVQRVDAANEAINALLSWPTERMRSLVGQEDQRKQEQMMPLSRRGTL